MTQPRQVLAVVATLLAAGCGASHHDSMVPLVYEHLRHHPAMQVEDVYKLVHQAAFGNGHLITDEGAARRYLLSELEAVKADATEPLVEVLTWNASVIRINLRPFKARSLDPELLVEAMLASARSFRPDRREFERCWQQVLDGAPYADGRLAFSALRAFGDARKAEGYPAIHHSDAYHARHQPAYRVLITTEAMKVKIIP